MRPPQGHQPSPRYPSAEGESGYRPLPATIINRAMAHRAAPSPPLFETLDAPLPSQIRIAISFVSRDAGADRCHPRARAGPRCGRSQPDRADAPHHTRRCLSRYHRADPSHSRSHVQLGTGGETTRPEKQAARRCAQSWITGLYVTIHLILATIVSPAVTIKRLITFTTKRLSG